MGDGGVNERRDLGVRTRRTLLFGGLALALAGAVLAFAVEESDGDRIAVAPLGGVLLAFGGLVALGAAIAALTAGSEGTGARFGDEGVGGSSSSLSGLQAVGGLIAVVVGVLAVGILAVIAMTRLSGDDKETAVALTSSAFGVISAMVGAYLGIKITADTAEKSKEEAKLAAVASHEAGLANQEVSAMREAAKEVAPGAAQTIIRAGQTAREEAARAPSPSAGASG